MLDGMLGDDIRKGSVKKNAALIQDELDKLARLNPHHLEAGHFATVGTYGYRLTPQAAALTTEREHGH